MDDNYYKEHKCCPKCGNAKVEHTSVGYFNIDRNRVKCTCGWKGIVDDLVPSTEIKRISNWEDLNSIYEDHYRKYELGKRYFFFPDIQNGIVVAKAIENNDGEYIKVVDAINAINHIFEKEF